MSPPGYQSHFLQRKNANMPISASDQMPPRSTQNAARLALSGELDVHAEDAREQSQREENDADDREDLEAVLLAVEMMDSFVDSSPSMTSL